MIVKLIEELHSCSVLWEVSCANIKTGTKNCDELKKLAEICKIDKKF